jgi:hypothetical protein
MKRLYFLLLIAVAQLQAIGQAYWQQEVHYTIDVSLNDNDHTLNGFLKLRYINHSPDTLTYIWFHLWPNAFKNDRTAFSEQTLLDGRTDFYFSDREKRGYINRLDFMVGNNTLKTEDHPQYIDIVKVYLPSPLMPGQETEITTPFHVKLPANFSRGGHTGHSYQVTQWYPKPAVYDRTGWHPMPYLELGEFYSEFGSFDVRITVPQGYVVAATGELQNEEEKQWLKGRTAIVNRESAIKSKKPVTHKPVTHKPVSHIKKKLPAKRPVHKPAVRETENETAQLQTLNLKPQTLKTLRYQQNNIHDFAWFADSAYIVKEDTIQLASGRVVQAFSFYHPGKDSTWNNSIRDVKDAIHFRSNLIGEYPYNVVSVVEAKMGFNGGMEYPTITSISPGLNSKQLDMTIEHELGHNWFYGILGTNERDYPWMDEGINTYYDNRYKACKYPDSKSWITNRMPHDPDALVVDAIAKIKKDQPVATPSAGFTPLNYMVMVYLKTGVLLKHLETAVGTQRFDSCMQTYFKQWQYKHPYPQDLQHILQQGADEKDVNAFFDSLQQKGTVSRFNRRKIKPAFVFSCKDYNQVNYINWMPIPGYNKYDGFMIGLALHNYAFPASNFQYFLAPLYATNSKQVNGIGRIGYTWRPDSTFEKIDLSVSGARFSTLSGTDSNGNKVFGGFYKIVPALRLTFKNSDPLSSVEKWIEWKTYAIGEKGFNYNLKSTDGQYYPSEAKVQNRYLNQLTFNITDYRVLYPYDVQLQVQQGDGFYRASATGNYFFNYSNSGGLQMRVFAAKFGYIGEKTVTKQFNTLIYQPKLTAVRGNEDYTYSNYFVGRNESEGLASQQIMMRDGGLKLRTDLFQGLQGRSDDWIASVNLNTTLPRGLFPVQLPLRIFFDAGTYADAWKKDAATSRFLYVAGVQLSLFKNLLNVYAPVLYSKEFRDNLKTVPNENTFLKKISFSIDIQRFNLRKVSGNKIPF